jgi:hypothetical protein
VQSDRVLKFDYRGAPQTIGVMREAALRAQNDPAIRELAEMACSGLDSKDYISEYLALLHFVLARTRYMRDPRTVELVKDPALIARQIVAGQTPCLDCDDLACLLAALILSVGGQCDFVTVAFARMFYAGQQQYSHVLLRALDPKTKKNTVLDPVAAEKCMQMLSRVKAVKIWPIA